MWQKKTSCQGWELALSLIRSCCSLKKSDFERIALVALYKRAAMTESRLFLFKKEQREWFACELSESLSKNERFDWKNLYFSYVFHCFSSFYGQERIAPIALGSVTFFLRSNGTDSIASLFKKEGLWANCSLRSFSWTNCSFAHIKWEIAWKTKVWITNPASHYWKQVSVPVKG